MKNVVMLIVVGMFVASCGKDVPVGSGQVDFQERSIIVGDIDWRDVNDFHSSHPFRVAGNAVADVQFANGGRCTGFMISDDVMMTNHHCIGSASDVVGMKVFMRHESGKSKSQYAEVKCQQFVGNDRALDFALVKCAGAPGAVYGKVELAPVDVVAGDDIYVVHQNCDYYTTFDCNWNKKVSEGKVVGIATDIEYDADTLGGSSGSPVFSADSNKVVAIHHAGYGGGWTGRGIKNMGVPMKKIVPFINSKFPGVLTTETDGDDAGQADSDDNDTFKKATFVGSSYTKSAAISTSTDKDTYKFNMKSGQVFSFEISFKHSKGDLDFKVYKKVGSKVKYVKKRDSSSDDESIKLRVKSNTTYYVQVFGYKGAKNSYKVKAKKY